MTNQPIIDLEQHAARINSRHFGACLQLWSEPANGGDHQIPAQFIELTVEQTRKLRDFLNEHVND